MDSFVFYESFAQAASTLGDKARLKLYDAVVKLGLSCAEDEPTLNQVCADIESSLAQSRNVFAQFLLIKPQILANFKRKLNGRKGAEFGALGGAPTGNKNAAKNNPKTTPNVKGNANVNVKGNGNGDIIPPISPQGEMPTQAKKFVKPTLEEVRAYCQERKNNVDAERWIDYHEANGWKVGKNPMKDWRAAVRTWERGDFAGSGSKTEKRNENGLREIIW